MFLVTAKLMFRLIPALLQAVSCLLNCIVTVTKKKTHHINFSSPLSGKGIVTIASAYFIV